MICLIALVLIFTAGCSARSNVSADMNAVADEILKGTKFSDQMSAVDQKMALKIYGLEAADVEKAKVYESTGATAEEVAAFEAKDESAAAVIDKAASERVKDQTSAFEGYQPKEMTKLKSPLLVQKGKYVVLVVADDTSAAKTIVNKYLG